MAIPFIAHNAVVFECRSGMLCVGDLVNVPARYPIRFTGICHLPASAIIPAYGASPSFSIDNAQMFLIDTDHYDTIVAAVIRNGDIVPDHELYSNLRAQHGTHFGYVVAGELFDSAFDGDGSFALDISQLRKGAPVKIKESSADEIELLCRVISSMSTLVCASCYAEEIMSHPELGGSPSGRGKKKRDWSMAMAVHAIISGWTAVSEVGSFGDITPLCPACKARREP